MNKYYLKFENKAEAIAALSQFRTMDEFGKEIWLTGSHTHALDIVGEIYQPTGKVLENEDGFEYPEMAPIEGFHVNLLLGELPEALIPYAIEPKHPYRVFG